MSSHTEALQHVSPGIHKWGPESIIQFCDSFRRDARELVLGYGLNFRDSHESNQRMHDHWTTDAKYLHWYDSNGVCVCAIYII
jgi:hypothetical protein